MEMDQHIVLISVLEMQEQRVNIFQNTVCLQYRPIESEKNSINIEFHCSTRRYFNSEPYIVFIMKINARVK